SVDQQSKLPFTLPQVLLALFLSGIAFLLLRLASNLISFARIKTRSQLVSDADGVKVYHAKKEIVPFSFGNAIFYNPGLHQASDLEEIMRHELVHVRQRHTLDILFAELLFILNWYNPFAWLIRHGIRQNLEFIADREVLQNGTDARAYQFLLLKVAGVPEFRLANQFNFSSLKQRIVMMNRLKSARIYLVRFLYLIPLTLALLAFFRTDLESFSAKAQNLAPVEPSEIEFEYLAGILMDAETGKPIANLPLEKSVTRVIRDGTHFRSIPVATLETISTDENGFYFWKIDVRNQPEDTYYYSLKTTNNKFKDLNLSVHNNNGWYLSANRHFTVRFIDEAGRSGLQGYYSVRDGIEPAGESRQIESEEAKQMLMNELPEFIAQNKLIVDFKNQYWKPKKTITKFRNGYFDKDHILLGYEDTLQFYLDGKKVGYGEINEEFEGYLIKPASREGDTYQFGTNKKLFYLTFPLFRDAPPAELATNNNVKWIRPDDFDLAVLENEPYILDGFRQVFGTGSNLMPLKSEIKRIAIFKGKLARYYDRKLDKLWWIETRPAGEVMERPEFATR
ncbi:M56 family metallopeptidase, partial [Persicitalea sp.]|uniref:M56 family metallopeptidase n=1 Tax=Persicitalea sp. TaxID=3100273 RepID=UPI003593A84A